jgi:alpha-ribazole phosphatase/probable phosphoglycerate mutase
MLHAVSGAKPWQEVISSPLIRCQEFAQHLSEEMQIPLTIDERLKEVGFGDWEGKTSDQLRRQDPELLSKFYHDPINNRPQGAEPLETFSQRVTWALQEIISANSGRHLLIIAHAGVIRAILVHVLSAPLPAIYRMSIATASISRITTDGERPLSIQFQGKTRL